MPVMFAAASTNPASAVPAQSRIVRNSVMPNERKSSSVPPMSIRKTVDSTLTSRAMENVSTRATAAIDST